MRVLQVHNQYFSGLGGEDTVVRLEEDMLRQRGHEVSQLIVSTSTLKGASTLHLIQTIISSVWSRRGYEAVERAIEMFRPEVVHVHNTFPLLSPSVYYAAHRNGACVVQTLHNYRFVCANGILLRNGVPCEDCVARRKWRGIAHRCYNGSLGISSSVVAIQEAHRIAGTFHNQVDAYIALTRFQRDIFVRDGFPADLVHIKPNFSLSNVSTSQPTDRKDQIVYVGSLRKEKGVDLLLDAWERVHPQNFRLILLGDGPYRSELQARYGSINSVTWMGFQSMSEVSRVLGESKYIAICSRWYEGFAMVLLEAFNSGTPAIAPNHAAFPELMDAGRCGFLFEPSNVESLAEAIGHAVSISDTAWREHSAAALNNAAVYSSDASYVRLLEIYDTALEHYCRTQ